VPARAPTFLFYTNRPHDIRPAYERFLVNQLRARYAFTGWPIRVFFRQK